MRFKTFWLAMGMLSLTSCFATNHFTEEQKKALQQAADRPIVCRAGDDCEAKWNRAIEWVNKYSAYEIRTVSDHLIQTRDMELVDIGSKAKFRYPAFTIVKFARSKGLYVIDFHSVCDRPLMCEDPAYVLRASFVNFVLGPLSWSHSETINVIAHSPLLGADGPMPSK